MDLLHISVDEYYYYLAISEDDDFQIHLRRLPNFCFMNNSFKIGLSAWQANMDVQPGFNKHTAIAYMCAYLSKSEESCSYAMKQSLKISIKNKENSYEQMKAIAQAYASNRECSVQEAVYHCLPELWLRRVFPGVIYANTNIPAKCCKILRSQQEISELPDESEDIFKKNMLDRYMDRPDEKFQNGKFASVSSLCYAEFLRHYYVSTISNENDWHPVELTDDMLETNLAVTSHYPPVISLMSSPDKLKCRKVPSVLKYFKPNKNRNCEVYAHHLLILFYPFRTVRSEESQ